MSNGETQLAAKSPLGQMVEYIDQEGVKKLYQNMLGKNAGSYLASAVNLVRNDPKLQACSFSSLKGAMMTPAILKLSIEKTLGQCYIVPYRDTATFQIGYKGIIQLCIRSGKYQLIHCSEIYADELKSHNPITGQVNFKDPSTFKMRYTGNQKDVIGHYAYFKLTSGFEKGDYMTVQEADAHARRFSQAYQYDIKAGKKLSPWSTDPIAMGNKTVIKRLLSKFGIMSVEIQQAIAQDDSFELAQERTQELIGEEQGAKEVVAEFETSAAEPEPAPQKKAKTKKDKKEAKAEAKKKIADEPEMPIANYSCKGCGLQFDEPKKSGIAPNQTDICPECLTSDIEKAA